MACCSGPSRSSFSWCLKAKPICTSNSKRAPQWIHPLSHPLASLVPEIHAPAANDTVRWLLIIGVIPAIMLLRNTLQYLSIYLTNWSAMHAIADIRTKLFSHLQNLSLGFFNRASTGDLIARITNDTQVLYSIVGSSFASAVKDPITIVCLLGYQLATQHHFDAHFHRGVSRVHRAHRHLWPQSPQIRPRGAGIQRRTHEPDARILHRQPRHQGLQSRRNRQCANSAPPPKNMSAS